MGKRPEQTPHQRRNLVVKQGMKRCSTSYAIREMHIEMRHHFTSIQFSSVQSLSRVRLFVTPWTAAHQTSLSITNSRRLLKLLSIASVMPSNHLILCHPFLLLSSIFPRIRIFSNESLLTSGDRSIGVSASTLVLPMNTQC